MTDEILESVSQEELSAEEINSLKKIRLDKLDALKDEGKNPFEITKFDFNTNSNELKSFYETEEARIKAEAAGDEDKLNAGLEELKETNWRIAGRIMSWRDMGKANFLDIQDYAAGFSAMSGSTMSVRRPLPTSRSGI